MMSFLKGSMAKSYRKKMKILLNDLSFNIQYSSRLPLHLSKVSQGSSSFVTSLMEVGLSIIQENVPNHWKTPSMRQKKYSSLISKNKMHC